jgi:hypothetical protein
MDIFEFSVHHPSVDSDKVAETVIAGSSAKADSMDIFEFSDHDPSVDSDKVAKVVVVGSPKMEYALNESGVEVINVDLFPIQEEEYYLCFPFHAGEKVELAAKGLHLCDSFVKLCQSSTYYHAASKNCGEESDCDVN